MAWRETFLLHFGPGFLGGLTFRRWVRLLRENGFSLTPTCLFRAMTISFQSVQNSLWAGIENRRYRSRIEQTAILPPLFVLGHWRSGTTHLHNLLTIDQRFAYPNNYQVLYPHTFLTTEGIYAKFLEFFLPKRRPMDNVEWNIQSPQEDEFALCISTFKSPYMSWVYSQECERYDRYLTFRGLSENEIAEWRNAFLWFLKKLTWKYRRPLILKSPPHTCRLRLLLEMFPAARFVHIHRCPYDVFQSSRKTFQLNFEAHRLQSFGLDDLDSWLIRQYREMYDAFFDERRLIPEGQFHEVGFEELETDPVGQLRELYAALNLPEFAEVAPAVQRYVDLIKDYRKNVYPELPAEFRSRISSEWRMSFEEWGYPG